MRTIDKVIRLIENILAVFLLITVVLIVSAQIIFRFILSRPLSWSMEAATYLMVLLVFLGIAMAQRDETHISMKALSKFVPSYGKVSQWITWCLMATMYLIFGIVSIQEAINVSGETIPVLHVQISAVYVAISICSILGIWHMLMQLPVLRAEKRDAANW